MVAAVTEGMAGQAAEARVKGAEGSTRGRKALVRDSLSGRGVAVLSCKTRAARAGNAAGLHRHSPPPALGSESVNHAGPPGGFD